MTNFRDFDDLKFLIKKYQNNDIAIKLFNCNIKNSIFENFVNCSSFLSYGLYKHIIQPDLFKKSLLKANFCKNRFCPICNWRRARKLSKQYFRVIDTIRSDGIKFRFIFLTLTIKNFNYRRFNTNYSKFTKAIKKFFDILFKKRDDILGYIRGIEAPIQKRLIKEKKYYVNLHSHFLILVKPEYFDDILDFNTLQILWKRSLGVSYNPILDIRVVRGSYNKAVLETIKYPFKHIDYLDLPDDVFCSLYNSFKNKRFFSSAGLIKQYYNKIYRNDLDDDLIYTDEDISEFWELIREYDYYFFNGEYVLTKER